MIFVIISVILCAIGGGLWGCREAYHADSFCFERNFLVKPKSFFGSQAWQRNYENNTYPGNHKPEWGNTFRDIWHFAGYFSRLFLVAGVVVVIWRGDWLRLVFLLLGLTAFSFASFLVYGRLRNNIY